MAAVSGVREVVFAMREHGEDMEREMESELDVLSQMAARLMRSKVTKWRTLLANSIAVSTPEPMVREIRPGVAYAEAVNDGVPAGKKGLPRFFDPASASIVAWLQSKAFAGAGRVRKGTSRFTARELELRDRYEGLAWHIRHFGVKAQPFIKPTADEMEPVMLRRLDLAVRRVLARRPDAGGASA